MIGRHISSGGLGLANLPEYVKKLGYDFFQIFLGSPQQVISKARGDNVLTKLKQGLEKNDVKMVIHGNYTINLCHPVTNKLFKTSTKSLIQDLKASAIIGPRCIGVIIHMGKNIKANNISNQEAAKNYVLGLKKCLEETPKETTIILETGASQGTEIGSRMDDLSKIFHKLSSEDKKRVRFCIDTCHIWASGYDISSAAKVKAFFNMFDKLIGVKYIICIHFNDSRTQLNSHVDRHADLGFGFIGSDGLKEVARFAEKHQIYIICETPLFAVDPKTNKDITYKYELDLIKSWLK